MDKKIIYHILIDRFSGVISSTKNGNHFMGGNLNGIIQQLDYIKNIGFNTILVSPFLLSTNYHGYHTENFYAVDPHFGSLETVHELIREAHARDLKLMFDFVPNHCSYKHPFFIEALQDSNSPYRNWFYISSKKKYRTFLKYKELPKFNLDNPNAADYLIQVCKYWVTAGFDYVRIDHALGPPLSFLSRLVHDVKQLNPQVQFIGEVWGQGISRCSYQTISLRRLWQTYLLGINQERIQQDYIGILDGLFDFVFSDLLIQTVLRGEKCIGNSRLIADIKCHFEKYPAGFDLVLMLDNHDMNRFLYYCKGDKEKLLDALRFMKDQGRSLSIYYGTECLMTHTSNIFDKTDYADLRVRKAFQLSEPQILEEITAILKR